jgi:hypothetical protein
MRCAPLLRRGWLPAPIAFWSCVGSRHPGTRGTGVLQWLRAIEQRAAMAPEEPGSAKPAHVARVRNPQCRGLWTENRGAVKTARTGATGIPTLGQPGMLEWAWTSELDLQGVDGTNR